MALSFDDLPKADAALLAKLVPLSDSMRGVACALARLGVLFRRNDAVRAQKWLTLLEPHPLYKFGQVMFDLLEFEDFMLDGDIPEVVPSDLADTLKRLLKSADLSVPEDLSLPDNLPELETGFFLYRDVLLGVLSVALHETTPD
ncbi:hypothetical protein [uncultured Roseobacter sp.]|uniref:hypothetical protein n=1 Tax=uncultured Roseobacter sp. TaxID=114847 RepID=UPI002603D607|nr:hypothetical protein [uncultured Roseobacter sp.]